MSNPKQCQAQAALHVRGNLELYLYEGLRTTSGNGRASERMNDFFIIGKNIDDETKSLTVEGATGCAAFRRSTAKLPISWLLRASMTAESLARLIWIKLKATTAFRFSRKFAHDE